jgi:hypothetical protein
LTNLKMGLAAPRRLRRDFHTAPGNAIFRVAIRGGVARFLVAIRNDNVIIEI